MSQTFKVEWENVRASISVPDGDPLGPALALGKFYEIDLLTALVPYLRGGTILDVGGHIGNHSAFFAHFGPVMAFEPDPRCAIHWIQTIMGSALPNTTSLVPHAAGATHLARHRNASLLPTGRSMYQEASEGQFLGTTIDHAAQGVARIDVIKMDIEGGELEALAGAGETLRRTRPLLAVECKSLDQRNAVATLLAPLGYEIGRRYARTPTYLFHPVALR